MPYLPAINNQRSLSRTFSRTLPKYFTAEEVNLILTDSLKEKKYKAYFLCLFLWNTGVRVSEALSVRVKDINLMGRTMRVDTLKRNNHERVIPLQTGFVGEIALWINQNGLKRDDRLFDFSRRTAFNLVRSACSQAGISDDRCHPHTFRHSFAVNCLLQGVPITVLQEWLGHRDISKTLIYTKILAHDSRQFIEGVKF